MLKPQCYTPARAYPRPAVLREPDLVKLGAELMSQKLNAERDLIAQVFADPFRLLPVADASGIDTHTFDGRDHAAIWAALLWAFNSGRLGADRETGSTPSGRTYEVVPDADRLALAPLVRRALEAIDAWREEKQSPSSSLWDAEKVVAELFDGCFPCAALVADSARQVLRLRRRLLDAQDHYKHACQLLAGEVA